MPFFLSSLTQVTLYVVDTVLIFKKKQKKIIFHVEIVTYHTILFETNIIVLLSVILVLPKILMYDAATQLKPL